MRSSVRPLNAACQKPLAGMVICGSGPNLTVELYALVIHLVFLIQICSIILPIRVVAFSHPLGTPINPGVMTTDMIHCVGQGDGRCVRQDCSGYRIN